MGSTQAEIKFCGEAATPREREVLGLIACGKSTKQIAAELGIAFRTVACHRQHLLGKLGVSNTAELVVRAMALGLLAEAPAESPSAVVTAAPLESEIRSIQRINVQERQTLAHLLFEARILRQESRAARAELAVARARLFERCQELMESAKRRHDGLQALSAVRD